MKKLLFTILFSAIFSILLGTAVANAQDYYVSNSGSDSNSGMSQEKPWKTVDKVNYFKKFKPGDVIRFKCGDEWREQLVPMSGSEKGYIEYTSYGTGEKPAFLGSINKSKVSDWTCSSKNIWTLKVSEQIKKDVGNIIFDHGTSFGIKVLSEKELDEQNKFWYDGKTVKIYSLKNPAEFYKDIECAINQYIVDEGSKSYVKYSDLSVKYGAAGGIGGGDTHHIIVSNCDVSYMGGGLLTETLRFGNGIEFWGNAHDNLVEGCKIWEIYDAALTNQGGGDKVIQYNITYTNNTIWNCEWSYEFWNCSQNGKTHNVHFENNVCRNAGYGWGHAQRPNKSGMHICFSDNTADTNGIYVENNVFEYSESCTMYVAKVWRGVETLVFKNNHYAQTPNKIIVAWEVKSKIYFTNEFETYKRDTGNDVNSDAASI